MKHFHYLAQIILPRPLDFLGKAPIFLAGWLIALGEWNLLPPHTPPGMREFTFALAWFLIQEGLIQQAKHMWNDLRDYGRDQIIPANQTRFVAARRQRPSAILFWAVLLRALLGLVLAYWLSPLLFALSLFIILLQMIYEWWAKPNAATAPLLSLAVVALGSVTRFLGGAFAAGWPVGEYRLWLYAAVFLAVGAAYAAVLWRSEALYLQQTHIPWQRGQSAYFLEHGARWISKSMGSAAVICGLLCFDAIQGQPWPPSLPAFASLSTLVVMLMLYRFYATADYESFVLVHVYKNHKVRRRVGPTTILGE